MPKLQPTPRESEKKEFKWEVFGGICLITAVALLVLAIIIAITMLAPKFMLSIMAFIAVSMGVGYGVYRFLEKKELLD